MTIGLVITSLMLGLRHGFDWDHIAAIADLSGSTTNRRRGLWLSTLYAVGHAVVVFALGTMALIAGASIPESLDSWMGAFVGLTLIWLGIWVLVDLARHGREFRLRSRWMLVLDGTFAGWRRVIDRSGRREIALEHEHEHHHDTDHQHDHMAGDDDSSLLAQVDASEHASHVAGGTAIEDSPVKTTRRLRRSHTHSHSHRLPLPNRADGQATAVGIGMLHGVGIESPTQIAVFVGSTSVVGYGASLGVLAAWCVGLVVANSILALLAGFGLLEARRNFKIYAAVAVFVAIGSIVMGGLYLFGLDVLPAIS